MNDNTKMRGENEERKKNETEGEWGAERKQKSEAACDTNRKKHQRRKETKRTHLTARVSIAIHF